MKNPLSRKKTVSSVVADLELKVKELEAAHVNTTCEIEDHKEAIRELEAEAKKAEHWLKVFSV